MTRINKAASSWELEQQSFTKRSWKRPIRASSSSLRQKLHFWPRCGNAALAPRQESGGSRRTEELPDKHRQLRERERVPERLAERRHVHTWDMHEHE